MCCVKKKNKSYNFEATYLKARATIIKLNSSCKLFCRRAFPSLSGGGSRCHVPLKKKGKGPMLKGSPLFVIKPRETWTHNFCLLSSVDISKTPNFEELSTLKDAGLGKKKVMFSKKEGDFEHLKSTLEKEFEKLKSQDGGFELLRAETGGVARPLKVISMPAEGYNIPYLKSIVGSSTLLYIRPMKSDLSCKKVEPKVNASSPMTKCANCSEPIPIVQLRAHTATCGALEESDGSDDDEDDENEFDKSSYNNSQIEDVATGKTIYCTPNKCM